VDVFTDKWLKLVVKNNLVDQFKQTWTSMIENSSKGDNYKLFKHDLKFEDYLDVFTILIYLHILHKTLTDFEFIRLQNLSIFGLFMKCGSKYFLRSFDKDGQCPPG
jgi:hypothetical protein